jgi:hypothetical protein
LLGSRVMIEKVKIHNIEAENIFFLELWLFKDYSVLYNNKLDIVTLPKNKLEWVCPGFLKHLYKNTETF